MSKETEIAWAAGFFDGEGNTCFPKNIHPDKPRPYYSRLSTTVAQTERGTLERFQAALGMGTINGPYFHKNKAHTPYYVWRCSSKNVDAVFAILRPYLSAPKIKQFEDKIAAATEYSKIPKLKTGPKKKNERVPEVSS